MSVEIGTILNGSDLSTREASASDISRSSDVSLKLGTNGSATPANSTPTNAIDKPELNDVNPSYRSIYSVPPPVEEPYSPEKSLADIPGVSYALEMFLASHMVESEDYCNKSDPTKLVHPYDFCPTTNGSINSGNDCILQPVMGLSSVSRD